MCWIVWKKRCNVVIEQMMLNPRVAADEAKKLVEEYMRLPKTSVETARTQARIGW